MEEHDHRCERLPNSIKAKKQGSEKLSRIFDKLVIKCEHEPRFARNVCRILKEIRDCHLRTLLRVMEAKRSTLS